MKALVQGKPDIVAGLIKDLPNFEVRQQYQLVDGVEFSAVSILIDEDMDIDHMDDFMEWWVDKLRELCLGSGHRMIAPKMTPHHIKSSSVEHIQAGQQALRA
jgi:hypothetical protein